MMKDISMLARQPVPLEDDSGSCNDGSRCCFECVRL